MSTITTNNIYIEGHATTLKFKQYQNLNNNNNNKDCESKLRLRHSCFYELVSYPFQ